LKALKKPKKNIIKNTQDLVKINKNDQNFEKKTAQIFAKRDI
jgi:hypothetical protein